MKNTRSIKETLALRLLKVVLSIYLCITVIITTIQMIDEYLLEEHLVKNSLVISQEISQDSLSTSLWNFDQEQLSATVQGILKQPIIVGIEIMDENNQILIQNGQLPASLEQNKKNPLSYIVLFSHSFNLMRNEKIIGKVTLYSSNQVVFNKVRYKFLVIIINAIIKTVVLWLLFIWAFNRFLTRQLDIFCQAMENIDFDKQKSHYLKLETFNTYELSRIEQVFNDLLKRIIEGRDKLDEINKTLEQKVIERTQQLYEKQIDLKKLNLELEQQINIIDKNVIIIHTNKEGKIIYCSEAFCNISGYSKTELLQQDSSIIYYSDIDKEIYTDLWQTIRSGKIWQGELLQKNKAGIDYWVNLIISPVFDEQQQIIGYSHISQNISDKKRIEELSITDDLTQLYNRRYFNSIFPKEIQRAIREKTTISFLIMDIDNFKQYNDNYGHQKGDQVLSLIGKILKSQCQRASDIVLRLGGEEFGIIFFNMNTEEAFAFAEKIRLAIMEAHIEHRFNCGANIVTASFGLTTLAVCPELTMDDFYRLADQALYQAKNSGRNKVIQVQISP